MTVKEIVASYLKEHGYDGLYSFDCDEPCGCGLTCIAPCGDLPNSCVAAYRSDDYHRFYPAHKRKEDSDDA
jgi:uncharacterized protein (DUF1499 family)